MYGLDDVAAKVTERTRHVGSEPIRKRFFGHLTIARVKSSVAMPRALGAPVEASFDVTEIALIQSRLHPDGARYERSRRSRSAEREPDARSLARWPTGLAILE